MMKKIFWGILGMLLLAGCYKDNREELYQNYNQVDCDTTDVGYSTDINAILTSNCALSGCHLGTSPQSGLDLSSYDDASAVANDGRLNGRITGTGGPVMPPGGSLPNCEIEQIQNWIEQGAPNN